TLAQSNVNVQPLRTFSSPYWVAELAFSPDDKTVVGGSAEGSDLFLWDVETGKVLQHFVGHTSDASNVHFAADGKTILSSSWDGTARIWDVATGKELRRFDNQAQVGDSRFSPDGRYVVTASGNVLSDTGVTTVRLWDANTGKEIRQFVGHTASLWSV